MRRKIHHMTHCAIIAALYVAISFLQNSLLPGSGSWAIQFRTAEGLCVLAFFTPAAIPGLAVGCLLFNLSVAGALPLDFLVGSAATGLAALLMRLSRGFTVKGFPLAGFLIPPVCNGLLVGGELALSIGGGFWLNAAYVALGEALVLFTLGVLLFWALRLRRLDSQLFGNW